MSARILSLRGVLAAVIFLFPAAFALADVEDVIRRSFDVRSGGRLTVDTDRGAIEVRTDGGNTVRVEVVRTVRGNDRGEAAELFEDFKVDFDHRGADVTVRGRWEGGNGLWNRRGNRLQIRYLVTVPRQYDVDVRTAGGGIAVDDLEGDVEARTSGGSLRFGRIQGQVNGKTSGGSITLEGSSGSARVETSGGSITLGHVRGDVEAHTSGGSINVEEVEGEIDASTSGGSVTARISRQPEGNCRLQTSGGSVVVYLAENVRVDLDAATSGGRVVTDIPVQVRGEVSRSALRSEINGGGPELYLRTSGGSIHLREL